MELVVRLGDRVERAHLARHGDRWHVRLGEEEHRVEVRAVRGPLLSLRLDGRQIEASVERAPSGAWRVGLPEGVHEVEVVDPLTWLARASHEEAAGPRRQQISAYMPGRVVEVLVQEGQEVTAGQGLVVLEAMKMENEIQAEGEGTVRRIHVERGASVEGGAVLVEIE